MRIVDRWTATGGKYILARPPKGDMMGLYRVEEDEFSQEHYQPVGDDLHARTVLMKRVAELKQKWV